MGRDAADEAGGGDQAAWRDLVARLELPAPAHPATGPWPDRENLGTTRASSTGNTDGSGPSGSGVSPGGSWASGSEVSPDGTAPPRGRVIRPAGFRRFADRTGGPAEPGDGYSASDTDLAADGRPDAVSGAPAGAADNELLGAADANADADAADNELLGAADANADDDAYADDNPEPWRPSARNLSAEDYLNLVDIGYIDYDIGNQDERYIPPPLPPQPTLDPVARGGWAAVLGGPGYLLIATLLGWQIPGWAQLAAVIAFVAGFVVLVFRLGDGPSKRDGPDQGAVV